MDSGTHQFAGRKCVWLALTGAALALGCGQKTAEPFALSVERAPLTTSFRQGDSGYSGVSDIYISSQNGGNGFNDGTSTEMLTWKATGSSPYETRSLVRFDNLSLPAGAQVTSATLTLTFENWWTGFTLRGYYLKSHFNATHQGPLGWLNRDAGLAWNTPGAKGSGTDIIAGTSFSNSSWTGNGDETKTFALDTAVVQSWLDNPAANNHGIVLVNDESDDKYLRIYTSDDSNVNRRPKLSIDYTVGSGSGCQTGAVSTWQSNAFTSGSSPFTVTFDATPSVAPTDAVVGLSSGDADAFSDLATIVRFNAQGTIDARNGGSYAALSSVTYSAGTAYHFRLVVDTAAHTYSIYVTPNGATETTIGSGYAFRTEQNTVSSLDRWTPTVDPAGTGTLSVCNFNSTGGGTNPPPPGSHPRIFLDTATLQALRNKAPGNAAWNHLHDVCTSYLGGQTHGVCTGGSLCNPYPNLPDVGEGYQGDGYLDAVLNLGVCYQIGASLGEDVTAFGARGAGILSKMTEFTNYARDEGYGIRNFGVGMAIGFDYLYPALTSPTAKSQIIQSLNTWLTWYETSGLARSEPHANYFSGYYATKAYASIATKGDDDPNADNQWNDFVNRLQYGQNGALHGGVAAYSTANLKGGGWYEGWQYGNLGVQNMSLPSLAAKTAKGLDLIGDSAHPYHYPLESARHILHFTWPSRDNLDDRDTLHTGSICPSNTRPYGQLVTVVAAMLSKWGDSFAPYFHTFARQVRTASGAVATAPWADFLFWDSTASELDYATTEPKSYAATNYVSMRSGWDTSATWASFRAAPYVVAQASTEQYPDAGAPAIVRGNTALLVNPSYLHTCYSGPQFNDQDQIHDEIYSSNPNRPNYQRIFNDFYNGTGPNRNFTSVDDNPAPTTRISHFDDKNGYVFARAEGLADTFNGNASLGSWSRDFVYLRPSTFVVYDRTVLTSVVDPHMNWHFPPVPTLASPPSSGAVRYNVTDGAGTFNGAITTVLPANANVSSPINVFSGNKMYRLEVRSPSPSADMRWLTVFDTGASSGAIGLSTAIQTTNVNGVRITAAGGNFVTLFGTGLVGTTISGSINFAMPAASTKVVIADLVPTTTYTVTATPSGGNLNVVVQTGTSSLQTTQHGVLYVNVSSTGAVSAGT
jgi:hypothetical protein